MLSITIVPINREDYGTITGDDLIRDASGDVSFKPNIDQRWELTNAGVATLSVEGDAKVSGGDVAEVEAPPAAAAAAAAVEISIEEDGQALDFLTFIQKARKCRLCLAGVASTYLDEVAFSRNARISRLGLAGVAATSENGISSSCPAGTA